MNKKIEQAFVIIATGEPKFGEMALSCCLSIKANNPTAKVVLIHTPEAIAGNEERIGKYFDFPLAYFGGVENPMKNPIEQSHFFKLNALGLCETCGITEAIILDADTVFIPGSDPMKLFNQKEETYFLPYVCDKYDFYQKKSKRSPKSQYWCNPDKANEKFGLDERSQQMPSINASFIYFKICDEAARVFEFAREIWDDKTFKDFTSYKESKTEEFCFNIACCYCQVPLPDIYRPIYLQISAGFQNEAYVAHHYPAFSLAADINHAHLDWYNRLADYYRNYFGIISRFRLEKSKPPKPSGPLKTKKIILSRIGGFGSISNGGVINPCALPIPGNKYVVILRSDANLNGYRGLKSEAECVPIMAHYDRNFKYLSSFKMHLFDFSGPCTNLVEDYRIFEVGDEMFGCFSVWTGKVWNQWLFRNINNAFHVERKFESESNEKNWAWFTAFGKIYFIHSIEPEYVLHEYDPEKQEVKEHIRMPLQTAWQDPGRISCSTMPVRYGEDYLVWIHKKQSDLTYLNSVMIIDGLTLKPTKVYAKQLLDQANIEHPFYVSSCIVEKDRILLFGGEKGIPEMHNAATAYSSVRIIDRTDFDNLINDYK